MAEKVSTSTSSKLMKKFKRSQFLPISIEEAWSFFSSPHNLSLITPKELGLIIKSDYRSKTVSKDDLIDYTVKPLLGIPMNWKTKITAVDAPYYFVDKQIKGPYKLWEHKHTFEKMKDGVMMYDEVNFKLPFYPLSKIFHSFIQKKLNHIFDYRTIRLKEIFSGGNFN